MLYLIRGLPGSGKSTMARRIVLNSRTRFYHVESDMYFIDANGTYVFDVTKLKDAHRWCQETTRVYLNQGEDVIVSNTFTQKWELDPYIEMANACGSPVEILEATGSFMNRHGVPEETVTRMKERWETIQL